MKGREHDDAQVACARVHALGHIRPETARRATTAILGAIGPARLSAEACDPGIVRALLGDLRDVETACDDLDRIPHRSERADERREAWARACDGLLRAEALLIMDHSARAAHPAPPEAASEVA